MSEPLVVCVFGEEGSGKSDLARLLAKLLHPAVPFDAAPPVVYGFTRPLKDYVADTFGLSKGDRGWRRKMHQAAHTCPPDFRQYLPKPGEVVLFYDYRVFCEQCWLKTWEEQVAERFPHARFVLADDARTEYEFSEAKRRGWFTVLVTGRRRHSPLHLDYWLRTERSVRRLARRHARALREVQRDLRGGRAAREGAWREQFDWKIKNIGDVEQLRRLARHLAGLLRKKAEALTPCPSASRSHGEREDT